MPYWLVYTRCDDCENVSCLQCRREERNLTIQAIEAEEQPSNSLNGPCETPGIMLERLGHHFEFDAKTGKLFFRVKTHD